MQVPDALLADKSLTTTAKTVLQAMWSRAEGSPPWTGARNDEIADGAGLSVSQMKRARRQLLSRGAIRREVRPLAGRSINGWGLARTLAPLQGTRMAPATAIRVPEGVVKREKTHRSEADRIAADLAQIARHARAGDSAEVILERLRKAKAPCSDPAIAEVDGTVEHARDGVVVVVPKNGEPRTYKVSKGRQLRVAEGDRVRAGEQLVVGEWHRVKVFRRVDRMAETMKLQGKGLPAGDIVARWKKTREG